MRVVFQHPGLLVFVVCALLPITRPERLLEALKRLESVLLLGPHFADHPVPLKDGETAARGADRPVRGWSRAELLVSLFFGGRGSGIEGKHKAPPFEHG